MLCDPSMNSQCVGELESNTCIGLWKNINNNYDYGLWTYCKVCLVTHHWTHLGQARPKTVGIFNVDLPGSKFAIIQLYFLIQLILYLTPPSPMAGHPERWFFHWLEGGVSKGVHDTTQGPPSTARMSSLKHLETCIQMHVVCPLDQVYPFSAYISTWLFHPTHRTLGSSCNDHMKVCFSAVGRLPHM